MIKICAVGDIALGNHPKRPGFGFYSKYKKGIPHDKIKNIFPKQDNFDIVFGNLEFSLTDDVSRLRDINCCIGSLSFVSFLKECGFNVLNVASNHALDYGADVFRKMVSCIQGLGIKVVGIADDFDPKTFVTINGEKIAFLGCSAHPKEKKRSDDLYNIYDDSFIYKIKAISKSADIICVSIHWGEEFIPIQSQQEQQVARAMIDEGANIIIGHHPHVLREIECFRNGIIAYSMGNFIGDMTWNEITRETGCLIIECNKRKSLKYCFFHATVGYNYFPTYLSSSEQKRRIIAQEKLRNKLRKKLSKVNYELLARRALRKNQWLTLLFFFRNIFKYKLDAIKKIVVYGIKIRLPWIYR